MANSWHLRPPPRPAPRPPLEVSGFYATLCPPFYRSPVGVLSGGNPGAGSDSKENTGYTGKLCREELIAKSHKQTAGKFRVSRLPCVLPSIGSCRSPVGAEPGVRLR